LDLSRPGLGKTTRKCSCVCTFPEYFILIPTEELHPELDLAGLFGQTVPDLVEGVHTLIIPKQDHLSIGVTKHSLLYIAHGETYLSPSFNVVFEILRD
jgi:hypothetical protein